MSALELTRLLPRDDDAEARLTAIAAVTQRGCDLAYDRGVEPDHFHSILHRRIWTAACACPEPFGDTRLQAIADATGIPVDTLHDLDALPRICLEDQHGHYTRLVLAVAAERAKIWQLLAELEERTGGLAAAIIDTDTAA